MRIHTYQILSRPAFFSVFFGLEEIIAIICTHVQVIAQVTPYLSVSKNLQELQGLFTDLVRPSVVDPQPHPVHVKQLVPCKYDGVLFE